MVSHDSWNLKAEQINEKHILPKHRKEERKCKKREKTKKEERDTFPLT